MAPSVCVCFLLERGSPPRVNPVIVEACEVLRRRGAVVAELYAEEATLRLDALRDTEPALAADLVLLKSNTELALSLAIALEGLGTRVLNRAGAALLAQNKVLAAATLLRAGIPTPRSLAAGQPAQLAAELAAGPLILKPYRGHYGLGVTVAERPDALPAAAVHPDLVFGQRYLAAARTDLKVYAIGEEVFGIRKRFGPDSFRQDGELAPLSPAVEQIARRCGAAFGLELYGIDVAETADGPYVVDVNSFPGYRGVPEAAPRLAEYILRAARGT